MGNYFIDEEITFKQKLHGLNKYFEMCSAIDVNVASSMYKKRVDFVCITDKHC